MATTKLANLVNPEVMGELLSTKLPSAIKIAPLANVDNSLQGTAGNTIVVPVFKYIGDATEVAEGVEIDLTLMQASSTKVEVKKVAKGVELTDESVLSGYGDPVGQAGEQILYSIANGIDKACVTALQGVSLNHTVETALDYNAIVDAVDVFGEEDNEEKYLIIAPKQLTALRKDANFIDKSKYGNDVMVSGEVGMVANCRVVVSNKVEKDMSDNYTAIIMKKGALTIFMKRDVEVETDRDITRKVSVITADEHFAVAVTDETKVVKLVTK